jgi:hypothetical protein
MPLVHLHLFLLDISSSSKYLLADRSFFFINASYIFSVFFII